MLQDRPFWQFTIVATFLWFTTGVYTLATPFYAKYTLAASPQAPSIIFGTVFVVAIAVVSFWSKLVREWGIKRTWLRAIGVMTLSAVVLGLAPNLAVGMSVVSIVMGFLPDAADTDTHITLLSIGLAALAVAALQKEE